MHNQLKRLRKKRLKQSSLKRRPPRPPQRPAPSPSPPPCPRPARPARPPARPRPPPRPPKRGPATLREAAAVGEDAEDAGISCPRYAKADEFP